MPGIPQEALNRSMVQQKRGISTTHDTISHPFGRLGKTALSSSRDRINDFSLWPEDSDICHTDVLSMKLNAFNQANKEIATNLRSWEPLLSIFDDGMGLDYFEDD